MSQDGSDVTRLTETGDNMHPSWSGDGRRLVFKGEGGIRMLDIQDSSSSSLIVDDLWASNPDWSKTNNLVLFSSKRSSAWDVEIPCDMSDLWELMNCPENIFSIDIDTGNIVQLTFDSSTNYLPTWSPDGEYIMFVSSRANDWEIFTMKADGTEVYNLTNNNWNEHDPAWSASGTSAFYTGTSVRNGGPSNVWSINMLTRATTQLTNDGFRPDGIDVSPDGKHLAFSSRCSECDDIRDYQIVLMQTEAPYLVVSTGQSGYDVAWQPQ